jgi:hypothetical protein
MVCPAVNIVLLVSTGLGAVCLALVSVLVSASVYSVSVLADPVLITSLAIILVTGLNRTVAYLVESRDAIAD